MIKIAKYDLEGNYLEILEGKDTNAIAIKEEVDLSSLKKVLHGTNFHAKGFQYRLLRSDKTYPLLLPSVWEYQRLPINKNSYPIGKYYNDKFITSYKSISEVVTKNFNINRGNLSDGLIKNKEFKHSSGFTFKKIE